MRCWSRCCNSSGTPLAAHSHQKKLITSQENRLLVELHSMRIHSVLDARHHCRDHFPISSPGEFSRKGNTDRTESEVAILRLIPPIDNLCGPILQDGSIYTGVSGVTISFSPLIPTIYCFSFLSILNARTNLLSNEGGFRSRADIEGLIPGMDFTVDMPSKIDCVSRDIPLTTSVVRSSEIKGLGNLDSPPDISEEKLQQEHQGSKQEIGIEDQA